MNSKPQRGNSPFTVKRKVELLRSMLERFLEYKQPEEWDEFWKLVDAYGEGTLNTKHENQPLERVVFGEWRTWLKETLGMAKVRAAYRCGTEYHQLMVVWDALAEHHHYRSTREAYAEEVEQYRLWICYSKARSHIREEVEDQVSDVLRNTAKGRPRDHLRDSGTSWVKQEELDSDAESEIEDCGLLGSDEMIRENQRARGQDGKGDTRKRKSNGDESSPEKRRINSKLGRLVSSSDSESAAEGEYLAQDTGEVSRISTSDDEHDDAQYVGETGDDSQQDQDVETADHDSGIGRPVKQEESCPFPNDAVAEHYVDELVNGKTCEEAEREIVETFGPLSPAASSADEVEADCSGLASEQDQPPPMPPLSTATPGRPASRPSTEVRDGEGPDYEASRPMAGERDRSMSPDIPDVDTARPLRVPVVPQAPRSPSPSYTMPSTPNTFTSLDVEAKPPRSGLMTDYKDIVDASGSYKGKGAQVTPSATEQLSQILPDIMLNAAKAALGGVSEIERQCLNFFQTAAPFLQSHLIPLQRASAASEISNK